jgi:ERCC4-type nuclease
MISVDSRAGSKEIAPLLRSLGVEVELTTMPFGDLAFFGYGIDGLPVSIGIEMKEISDVLACVVSGRFAGHQLPGLIKSYDHVWLLMNGIYRSRPSDGVLEIYKEGRGGGHYWVEAEGRKRGWMWRDVESWLTSVSVLGGIRVQHCKDWKEGALWAKTLHNWLQREEHKSCKVIYSGKKLYPEKALMNTPSLVRRLSKELPRVGIEKSAAVAAKFSNMEEMCNASEKEWAEIDGIGKTLANTIYRAIHNGKH